MTSKDIKGNLTATDDLSTEDLLIGLSIAHWDGRDENAYTLDRSFFDALVAGSDSLLSNPTYLKAINDIV